jgi:hypothetical protein
MSLGNSWGSATSSSSRSTSNWPAEEVREKTSSPFWVISEAEKGTRVRAEGLEAMRDSNLVYRSSMASDSPARKVLRSSSEMARACLESGFCPV